jgi:hypothetical protein
LENAGELFDVVVFAVFGLLVDADADRLDPADKIWQGPAIEYDGGAAPAL